MAKKKYWQSFSELKNTAAFQKSVEDEFKEELPFENADGKSLAQAPASRRDFLKYLGFSTAAAIAAASCETHVRKAIPYVNKPGDMIPGVADYYATTYVSGGEAIPIVAKVRDGRPIKIEGNTLSTFSKGSTSARIQASVLDLYDTARLRHPMANNSATSYESIDKLVGDAMASLGGAPVVLLTSTISSPTSKQVIAEFLAKYPGSRHVQFDAVSYSGILLANEASYGQRAIPSIHFENAKVIVSLGADFLGTWLSPVEFQKGYGAGRKIDQNNPQMSKHYQFESMLSMTGSNADARYTHRPSETGMVAAALLGAVNGQGASGVSGKLKEGIEAAAKDLVANNGKAVVVSGSNDPNVQLIVNAINAAVGANGSTIDWSAPLQMYQGIDSDMNTLVADMEAGRVGALLVYGANPAYEYFDADKFTKAIGKVKLTVSFNERMDETTQLCKFILPAPHFLESWGDAEPKQGYVSMMQPTINPLFQTRPFQETLLKWSGNTTDWATYFKNYWVAKLGGEAGYNKALQDGVAEPQETAIGGGGAFNSAALAQAVSAANSQKKTSGYELVVYQKVTIGDGKQANNPWLLEMPDPISRVSWDNYAMVSPQYAKKELGIDLSDPRSADNYEVERERPVIKITANNKTIELPVMVIPGMHPETIAVAVGYGRHAKVGRAVVNDNDGGPLGKNVYPMLTFGGATVNWSVPASIDKTTAKYELAVVQTHNSYEGRHAVLKEVTLEEFQAKPSLIRDARAKELEPWGGLENYETQGTIYPTYDRPGIKWGMSIDLNSCYGCGACVVACHAENNVPVVGKNEVMRFHDMHWLRIDRYFSGNPDDPESIQTVFQPMLCQHCDNAPCENVCPVAATHHSSEGMNMMAYNRCIGTRYCANNCPFKVRRFNWADYTGADSFKHNQDISGVGKLNDAVLMMNDDLTRMVLNPDVTVRSRGVMEKCSFCVQRLQDGKLKAKKENRTLNDGDIKTACQQACSADAIVFGNANDPKSAISQTREQNNLRLFHALEPIHVMPNINYLAKVRNTQEISNEGHLGQPVEHRAEAAPAQGVDAGAAPEHH